MPLAVCGHFLLLLGKCVCIYARVATFLPLGFSFYHPVTATLHIVYRGMFTRGLFHCELRDLKVHGPPCSFFLINRFSGGGSLE